MRDAVASGHIPLVVGAIGRLGGLGGKLARLTLDLIDAALNLGHLQTANVTGELLGLLSELSQGG